MHHESKCSALTKKPPFPNFVEANVFKKWDSLDIFQIRASVITKWVSCFVLQNGASGITR